MTPDELKAALEKLGLDNKTAGDILGKDPATVWRWITGVAPIPKAVALVIEELLISRAFRKRLQIKEIRK